MVVSMLNGKNEESENIDYRFYDDSLFSVIESIERSS